jgi:hypothetical protein
VAHGSATQLTGGGALRLPRLWVCGCVPVHSHGSVTANIT